MQFLLVASFVLLLLICSLQGEGAKKSGGNKKKSPSVSSSSSTTPVGVEFQGKERLKTINAILMENRQRNTVRLVDSNFTKYVLDQPRLYHAAIFLTASARKYECIVCKESIKEYKKAAKYYSENYPDLSKISEETRIVFF